MNIRKLICLLLALLVGGIATLGAWAEVEIPDPETLLAQSAETESVETEEPETDDSSQIDEDAWIEYTMEQPEVVDEMYTVDDFAVTEGLPDAWVNILLLGTDNKYTEYKKGQYGLSDSMVIMSINLDKKQAKLTSIMRDIWVEIHGVEKAQKLNAACMYGGPALTMRTINEQFGMNLQYYVLVNLSSMAEIIDLLGGLDLDVTEEEMNALNKGLFDLSPLSGMEKLDEYGSGVHLNGNQATAFARIRKIDSDYRRTERQRYVLTSIAKRLQQENAGTIVGVAMKLLECVETNMNFTQLMTIAGVGLQMDMDAIEQFRIPVDGTFKSGNFDGVWCIKCDFKENKKKLHAFIYG